MPLDFIFVADMYIVDIIRDKTRPHACVRICKSVEKSYHDRMNYQEIKTNPTQFLTLTSLTPEEFQALLPTFQSHWVRYYRYHTLEGKLRKLPNFRAERNTRTLPTACDKLFFLLTYLKTYPLQQFQAASFSISQGKVSQWVKLLLPLLKESLSELGMLPERRGAHLASALAKYNGEVFTLDGAERPVERSQDDDNQQDHYSGKQKDHTVKNNLICRDNQQILYLSETYEGKVHDKKIADEELCVFPAQSRLRMDLGYQGYQPEEVRTLLPVKKPRNSELSPDQKKYNEWVSRHRVVVEHGISGVKRCRIVKDRCRHFLTDLRDQIMLICTGLHNFRVSSPHRSYG